MQKSRHIICPRCGADVRIPWFWVVGIEGIFRCRECRQPFKTGYKMGAFFSALGLCLSMAVVQVLVYLLSIYTMPLFVLLLIPLWIFFAYQMRKRWMLRRVRRAVRRSSREEEQEAETEPQSPEEEYMALKKLPADTPFETEETVVKNPFTGETF